MRAFVCEFLLFLCVCDVYLCVCIRKAVRHESQHDQDSVTALYKRQAIKGTSKEAKTVETRYQHKYKYDFFALDDSKCKETC